MQLVRALKKLTYLAFALGLLDVQTQEPGGVLEGQAFRGDLEPGRGGSLPMDAQAFPDGCLADKG